MGHANMIACQLAKRLPEKTDYLSGWRRGAINASGECSGYRRAAAGKIWYISVRITGRMNQSVGCRQVPRLRGLSEITGQMGYHRAVCVHGREELQDSLFGNTQGAEAYILEIAVSLGAREDLGRPKETAEEK